ncbi:hypothetical protein BaRGS_00001901 [Batillaria attramentaria]|uniref:Uncharacterized protein n=1 Tax=Batillaria attramentaria TaxID=370345 RepID=A0ABD0M542_9CAEN
MKYPADFIDSSEGAHSVKWSERVGFPPCYSFITFHNALRRGHNAHLTTADREVSEVDLNAAANGRTVEGGWGSLQPRGKILGLVPLRNSSAFHTIRLGARPGLFSVPVRAQQGHPHALLRAFGGTAQCALCILTARLSREFRAWVIQTFGVVL